MVTAPPENAAALSVRFTTWFDALRNKALVSVEPVAGTVGNSRVPLNANLGCSDLKSSGYSVSRLHVLQRGGGCVSRKLQERSKRIFNLLTAKCCHIIYFCYKDTIYFIG